MIKYFIPTFDTRPTRYSGKYKNRCLLSQQSDFFFISFVRVTPSLLTINKSIQCDNFSR